MNAPPNGKKTLFVFLLFILALTACEGQELPQNGPGTPAVPAAFSPTFDDQPAETADDPQPENTLVPTPRPTGTTSPTRTPSPEPSPTQTPVPVFVNDLPAADFIVMSDDVIGHMRRVFELGQEIGRDPRAYSILGDSTALNPQMLARFDETDLNLGDYAYLHPAVTYFSGSFDRYGVSARHGLHSWSVFDPLWADKKWCLPNETVLDCEFRLQNPSVIIIRLGSNDAGAPDGFRFNVRKAIEYSLENGVMPVVATKADRFEGEDNINNIILRELAAAYQVPLWDFDLVAETLPERGLDSDGVHMVEYLPNDYTDPAAFQSGHAIQDLTGLMMLFALWQQVIQPFGVALESEGAPPTPFPILLNGLPVQSFVIMSEETIWAMSVVFYEGQARGRIANRFSKIGDSLIATPESLTRFDDGTYDLGDYDYLQSAIEYFDGSFARYGVGIKPGMRSWSVFDPDWADPEWCEPEETVIACEIRLNNPAVILVIIGTNDNSEAQVFEENMRRLVIYATENGVIPILLTKADRYEGEENRNNLLIRQIAVDYHVPLLDFDLVASTLPNRGLREDNVHLTSSVAGNFRLPGALEVGYGTHNLVILLGLHTLWQEVIIPAAAESFSGEFGNS